MLFGTVAVAGEFEARVVETAVGALGTAYHDGPLGEGPDGEYDTDPLIDLTRVDCVTFVEQTVAQAAGKDEADAFDLLQAIRYAGGQRDFEHRNHFFIADWIADNPWCQEVTATLGVETKTVTRTISRRDFFQLVKAPSLGQDTADRPVSLKYVPSSQVADAVAVMPSPSLVVFIGQIDWLFALHCGLFIKTADAPEGRLFHASSKAGQVVAVDLADYVAEQGDRYLGVAVYRVTAPDLDDETAAAKP